MNIFVLSEDPVEAAKFQCNKHITKMPTESAQMLCTVHRMLDGTHEERKNKRGHKLDYWVLPDIREGYFYKPVHIYHPCTVWTAKTKANYEWHYLHFMALCEEYTRRYGRIHACQKKFEFQLAAYPINILDDWELTPFPLAMKDNPECMFEGDPVRSYRAFYQTKQDRFDMVWTKTEVPSWFEMRTCGQRHKKNI